jgi:hypothetical protein
MSALALRLERDISRLAGMVCTPAAWTVSAREVARRSGIAPDPWQADLLDSRARQVLLNCSRQSGKSTITAILAAHQALTPDSLTLILSPSLRQSGELYGKVRGVLTALGPSAPTLIQESTVTLIQLSGTDILSIVDGFLGRTSGPSHPLCMLWELSTIPSPMRSSWCLSGRGRQPRGVARRTS